MINVKCIIVTSNQDKVLPIPLRSLKAVFLKAYENTIPAIYTFTYLAFVVLLL